MWNGQRQEKSTADASADTSAFRQVTVHLQHTERIRCHKQLLKYIRWFTYISNRQEQNILFILDPRLIGLS